MRKIVGTIVLIQCCIIAFLGYIIFYKFFVPKTEVTPLFEGDHIQGNSTHLKYFYELRPNSQRTNSSSWLPEKTINTINDDGLNERFDYSTKAPENTFRIIMLGDSWTFGLHLDTADNLPEQLEDSLNNKFMCDTEKNFEVINLGVPGYDIEYSIERFKTRGKKYNPDLVIWLVKKDDLYQINEYINKKSNEYKKEMTESGELKKYQQRGSFYPYAVKATYEFVTTFGEDTILEFQKKQLQKINTMYTKPLLFLTFSNQDKKIIDFLEEFTQSRRNTYFSNEMLPLNERQTLPDGHPNKLGYESIANYTLHYLKTNKIIPCS